MRFSVWCAVLCAYAAGFLFGLAVAAEAESIGEAVAVEAAPPTFALSDDIAAAEGYWGLQPIWCASRLAELAPLPPDRWGQATMPPGGRRVDCVMTIAPELETRPWLRCEVVVHEYGHWLGYGHNDDPSSPMYADGPYWATIPQCENRRSA